MCDFLRCDCLKKNCLNLIAVTSVEVADGITTLTIPQDTAFNPGRRYCLGFFGIEIPIGTGGTQVNVSNGTDTYTIFKRNANYWRPCRNFMQNDVLKLVFLNDPAHFIKG